MLELTPEGRVTNGEEKRSTGLEKGRGVQEESWAWVL